MLAAAVGLDHPLEHRRRARRLRRPRLVHGGQGRRDGAHALARGRPRARRHPRQRDRTELRLDGAAEGLARETMPRARRSSSCTCSRSRRRRRSRRSSVFLASDESAAHDRHRRSRSTPATWRSRRRSRRDRRDPGQRRHGHRRSHDHAGTASCAFGAIRTLRTAPVVEQRRACPRSSDGVITRPACAQTLNEPARHRARVPSSRASAVRYDAQRTALAARHVDALGRSRRTSRAGAAPSPGSDAQRRAACCASCTASRASAPELIQSCLPSGENADVVRQIIGGEGAQEAGTPRARHVHEREPRRLGAERRDDACTVGRDRDVPRALPHLDTADHPRARARRSRSPGPRRRR